MMDIKQLVVNGEGLHNTLREAAMDGNIIGSGTDIDFYTIWSAGFAAYIDIIGDVIIVAVFVSTSWFLHV